MARLGVPPRSSARTFGAFLYLSDVLCCWHENDRTTRRACGLSPCRPAEPAARNIETKKMSEWKLKRREDESDEEYAARVEDRHQRTLARHRAYRETHRELYRECARRAYRKNIEESRAKNREYERRNRAKRKLKDDLWRRRNKKYVAERAKRYRYANYSHRREVEKAYYKRTSEHRTKWWREYRAKNKERLSEAYRKWDLDRQKRLMEEVASGLSLRLDENLSPDTIYGAVYLISNVCTDKFYVGQAVCVKNRYRSGIKSFVKDAEHRNHSKVLEDFETFGEDSFSGPVVIAVARSKPELDFLESHYIKVYDSFNSGYNQTRGNIKSALKRTRKKEIA